MKKQFLKDVFNTSKTTPVLKREFIAPDWANSKKKQVMVGDYPITCEFFKEHTADVDAGYHFDHAILPKLLRFFSLKSGQSSDGLLLTGPTGCGKTSIIEQFTARMHRPLLRVTADNEFEVQGLIVDPGLENGETIYRLGPLSKAMKEGFIFQLDEIDLVRPGVLSSLNDILSSGQLTISETGEVIKSHPLFRFVATANTAGNGDETGSYQDREIMDQAFLDRFRVIKVDYMDPMAEYAVLEHYVPQLTADIKEAMIKVANDVRSQFKGIATDSIGFGSSFPVTMSTRTLLRWAVGTVEYQDIHDSIDASPIHYALNEAILDRVDSETAKAVTTIVEYHIGS